MGNWYVPNYLNTTGETTTLPIQKLTWQLIEKESRTPAQQWVYVVEEIGELLQAQGKFLRGYGNNNLIEEACDVLMTIYMYLKCTGISDDEIEERIVFKLGRALKGEPRKNYMTVNREG